MAKTTIDWADYVINPVKGLCPVGCSYCYARGFYRRFKWNPEIRYIEPGFWIDDIERIKTPSRIFVGSTMELFGDWIPDLWLKDIFSVVRQFPQHTFIFLTKRPENLAKWSPFPDNVWVGVSATYGKALENACNALMHVQAPVKFISAEPIEGTYHFLTRHWFINAGVSWVVIGQQSPVRRKTRPEPLAVQELLDAAKGAGIPVFVKDNILEDKDLHWYGQENWNRQELPVIKPSALSIGVFTKG